MNEMPELTNIVRDLRQACDIFGERPGMFLVHRSVWEEAREEIETVLFELPFVREEYLDAEIEHFLVKLTPVVPMEA